MFISMISSFHKYFDNYTSSDLSKACDGGPCLGHALTETTGWYDDKVSSPNSTDPWLGRGTNSPGVFATNFINYATMYDTRSVLISIGG